MHLYGFQCCYNVGGPINRWGITWGLYSFILTCGVCYFTLLRVCVCVFIAVDRLAVAIQQVSAVADKHDAGNHYKAECLHLHTFVRNVFIL